MGDLVEVALPFSLPHTLVYYSERPFPEVFGRRVIVPLKSRMVVGCVVGKGRDPGKGLKAIRHVVDERPLIDEDTIAFARWISRRFFYPFGMVMKHFFPPSFFVDTGGIFVFSGVFSQGFEEIAEFAKKRGVVTKRELVRLFGKDLVSKAIDEGVLIPDPGPRTESLIKKVKLYRAVPGKGVRGRKKAAVYDYVLEKGKVREDELRKVFKVSTSYLRSMEKEGLFETQEVEVLYEGFLREGQTSLKVSLSDEQLRVVDDISSKEGEHLLFGVTGSGKTFCFLEVAKRVLDEGGQVLIVVPEVGLTPQLLRRVEAYFEGKRLGLYHSYLTERERSLTWFRALDGEVDLVLGTRSSIFLPLKRLKLIVIDEEHDSSLVQESGLRYDVRELASYMSKKRGIKVVYSSATPSFETFYRALRGEVRLHRLERRYGDVSLPRVEIVDLRREDERAPFLSKRLVEKIEKVLLDGKQVIVFHARRGYSPYAICSSCGYTFKCVNCSLTLVYHRKERIFKCHWCGYEEKGRDTCPKCGSYDVRFYGAGSEKIEEELKKLFPGAKVERLDSDVTRKKGVLTDILFRFYNGEIDILVGTNMVVKGHDFPGVMLVGVTGTDNILNLPDYKAAERNFQVLAQVSGRSGRKEEGEVVIQTHNPDHYSIKYVLYHDYESFFKKEMGFRKGLSYPPFKDMLLVVLRGKDKGRVFELGERMKLFLDGEYSRYARIGPIPAPVPRMKGFYRVMVIVKGEKEGLIDMGWNILNRFRNPSVSLELILNPETLLI